MLDVQTERIRKGRVENVPLSRRNREPERLKADRD